MLIQAIIKSVLPLTMKKKQRSSRRLGSFATLRWHLGSRMGELYIRSVYTSSWKIRLGGHIEAYINDIVVKSEKCGDLLYDLKETFVNLHKYKMILNPKKCVFRVSSGKFLGYMV
jgi:hypothetical protein